MTYSLMFQVEYGTERLYQAPGIGHRALGPDKKDLGPALVGGDKISDVEEIRL